MTQNVTQYEFIKKIQNLNFVDEIWLFGSRSRQSHHERSDIDIDIVCPNATDDDWLKVCDVTHNSDTLLKIDCIRFDKNLLSPDLYQNILQDKQVIYVKKKPWYDSFYALGRAIQRLNDVLHHPQLQTDDYMVDAAIQRFEFTIELFWKVLKKLLSYEKVESTTPRDVLNKAYQYELIHDENLWLSMLDDRNNTSHAYDEKKAKIIFKHIQNYLPVFQKTYLLLQDKYQMKIDEKMRQS